MREGSGEKYMSKSKKKTAAKNKILILVIIAFAVAPLLINVGLVFTDFIYEKTGATLTAYGLNNVEWLDFWKQYLAIAISFLGVYLVYISSSKDREIQLREKKAQQYLEEVQREEAVLVEVVQSFNIGAVYEALLQQARSNIYEGRKVLANSRVMMDLVHIKFELLTELCDDFKKCEKCSFSPCHDKTIMVELRDLFYNMEKHYFNMLDAGEKFLVRLNQDQQNTNSLSLQEDLKNNTEQLVDLYKRHGSVEEVTASKTELQQIKERIKNLEKSMLDSEEMSRFVANIQKEKEYIEKEARPKFIKCCKAYIDTKKAHAEELRTTGYIKYNKGAD